MGSHDELMRRKGIYFELVQQQEKQKIEENSSRTHGWVIVK